MRPFAHLEPTQLIWNVFALGVAKFLAELFYAPLKYYLEFKCGVALYGKLPTQEHS